MADSRIMSSSSLLLLAIACMQIGCSRTPPPEALGSTSFHVEQSLVTIHQFGDRLALAVWMDVGEEAGCGYGEHSAAFFGSVKTADGRRLS